MSSAAAVASNDDRSKASTVTQDCGDSDNGSTFHRHVVTSPEERDVLDTLTGKVLDYYNSAHVFDFYYEVWGGEHLHVGLHSMMGAEDAKLKGVPLISKSSSVSTRELFARFFPSGSSIAPDKCTIMDMGAGFGGTARMAAKELGCKVICIGICKRENDLNATLSKAAGLDHLVIIPGEKSYFDTGEPASSCDVVCSQDALLLGGKERHRAVAEAARVLKPGGRMVFTDIMRMEHATPQDLEEVYQRDGVNTMSSVQTYQQWGKDYGLEFVEFVDHTHDLVTHYELVKDELMSRRGDHKGSWDEFIDHTATGIDAWINGGKRRVICWGFMVFQKPV